MRAEHKRKEREKAFESLISLPSEQQETRLGELAKRLDEDVAVIRDHFTAFVGMQSWTASTDSWNVELWPDPVELGSCFRRSALRLGSRRPQQPILTHRYVAVRSMPAEHEHHALYSSDALCTGSGQETSNVNGTVAVHVGPDDRWTVAIRLSYN